MSLELPYRGTGVLGDRPLPGSPRRPTAIPLPPARMPRWRGGRPLKRWRYVGVFSEELMLCAGDARVGPGRQTFWAVWDRSGRRLHERTRWLGHARVDLTPGRVLVRDGEVSVELELDEGDAIECVCRHGRQYAWTRKQGGVAARGRVLLGARRIELAARAIVDDSAGYHARETAWRWSAGVGTASDRRELAWNLVEGINDPPVGSERTLWLDGEPRELSAVRFEEDLGAVRFADGAQLRFAAEAQRSRADRLLVMSSEYCQPFGTFSGTFPGGVALRGGLGVMERHRARW